MIELYVLVSFSYIWGGDPSLDVGPGVYVREDVTIDAQPAVLHWTPADGFWVSSDVQVSPHVRR